MYRVKVEASGPDAPLAFSLDKESYGMLHVHFSSISTLLHLEGGGGWLAVIEMVKGRPWLRSSLFSAHCAVFCDMFAFDV